MLPWGLPEGRVKGERDIVGGRVLAKVHAQSGFIYFSLSAHSTAAFQMLYEISTRTPKVVLREAFSLSPLCS